MSRTEIERQLYHKVKFSEIVEQVEQENEVDKQEAENIVNAIIESQLRGRVFA